jgi:hypothetical protein
LLRSGFAFRVAVDENRHDAAGEFADEASGVLG